jgi:putative N-acetylmannosamine-6-phosphate epimerase
LESILADGVIGLGFGYTETDQEDAEPDSDFVEALVKQKTTLQLTR